MPMVMPYEAAWEKLVAERVDTRRDLVVVSKADIETVTGNELRLMAKMDSSADVPAALRRHGYFLLPIKNGEYLLVRGNGFHALESLPEPPTVFRPQLDFDLMTLSVGDSEMQHLDYCYNIGLFEKFAGATGLRQTIRGRKRMPAIEFSVGALGPIRAQAGVQVEVDSGCEGRDDIVLIEGKGGQPPDFIVRQLFYPYRKWRHEIPQKRIRPWFFCSHEVAGRRLYRFWEYAFADDVQYQSLTLRRGEAFFVEPRRARLTVEELLRAQAARRADARLWDVPQADSLWRVAEMPLLVEQGINTSAKVAAHYGFDPRQSSYYRQAAEYLGLVSLDKRANVYQLTDLGREYVSLSADERRELLAGLLAQFPPMRATLELSSRVGERGIGRSEIAALIARHSAIGKSTPGRRAATLLSWLRWLQTATGAVQERQERFSIG
ncbi:MAG: AAA-associated domain-containing protein [Verrucomicrobia bacterium]|nr:AAA-associated domain-containing protein [Verrucomicrobiota bacterium]